MSAEKDWLEWMVPLESSGNEKDWLWLWLAERCETDLRESDEAREAREREPAARTAAAAAVPVAVAGAAAGAAADPATRAEPGVRRACVCGAAGHGAGAPPPAFLGTRRAGCGYGCTVGACALERGFCCAFPDPSRFERGTGSAAAPRHWPLVGRLSSPPVPEIHLALLRHRRFPPLWQRWWWQSFSLRSRDRRGDDRSLAWQASTDGVEARRLDALLDALQAE